MSVTNPQLKASSSTFSADIVRTYLHEIGRVPLLTREQEIVYGKQVQRLMAIQEKKDKLIQKLHRQPTLTELAACVDETEAQLNYILEQGQRAKRKMIEANLRLVVSIAKRYQKRNLEFLDLIQEGTLGLQRAAEKFDPTQGYKFSTYAYWWVRQAMTRAIAQQSRTIRLPIHIIETLNKIKKVQRELSQQLRRNPTPAEIGQVLDLQPAQIREYLTLIRKPISLDLRIGDNQDTDLQDMLPDEGSLPENFILQESLRQDLKNLLAGLTPQQREVLNLRFGLEDGQALSLAQIGVRLQKSREWVRQLEQQALGYLRRRKVMLQDYLAS